MNKRELAMKLTNYSRQRPDDVAIFYRGIEVTYGELTSMVERISAFIQTVPGNGPVALHLIRSPHLIASLFACWHAGKAFVALDPKHPYKRKNKIIEDAKSSLVLVDSLSGLMGEVTVDEVLSLEVIKENRLQEGDTDPSLAYILYTSGSTGEPKGICLTEENVAGLLNWAYSQYSLDELRCVLAATTITFDLSVFEIFVPLTCGQSIFLTDSIMDVVEDLSAFSKVSLVNTVPSAMREIVRHGALPSNTRVVNLAGELLEWSLVDGVYGFPSVDKVYNLYGPSEDTTYSTFYFCDRDPRRRKEGQIAVPIGCPVTGSSVVVLDANNQPAPSDVEGEICLMGPKLALGYQNDDRRTEEKFIIYGSKRLYRTGDLGFEDEKGVLHYKGRLDNQVKVRGFRIELEEVERRLLSCEGVLHAVVAAVKDGDRSQLLAGVQLSGVVEDESEFQNYLRQQLTLNVPEYMVPQQWLITNRSMARTTSGKLSRKALIQQFYDQAANGENTDDFEGVVSRILGVAVDLSCCFMDQGGDSLLALRLLSEFRKRWNGNISLSAILDRSIPVAALKKMIVSEKVRSMSVNGTKVESSEVSAPEYRMWKVIQSNPDSCAYNVCVEYSIVGSLDEKRLMEAYEAVIGTAMAFKTNYHLSDGVLTKGVSTSSFNMLLSEDLESARALLYNWPFRLERDFLARAALVRETGGYRLLLCTSHLAMDGVGLNALLQKISLAYGGEEWTPCEGIVLEESDSEAKYAALEFWKKEFFKPISLMKWPQSTAVKPAHKYISRELDSQTVESLRNFTQSLNCTFPILLMALTKIALYRVRLGRDLIVGCPVANRCGKNSDDKICSVTNTLPIRTCVDGSSTVGNFIKQVYQHFLSALEHQEVSIDCIVENVIAGDPNLNSLFDVLFSYMDFGIDELKLDDCIIQREFLVPKGAKSPLVISQILQSSGSVKICVEYNTERVGDDYAGSIVDILKNLSENLSQYLNESIDGLNLFTSEKLDLCRQMVVPQKSGCCEKNLISWLKRVVESYGHKIAINDHGSYLTYEQLWNKSLKIAAKIAQVENVEGRPIGLAMRHSPELIAAIFGILMAGGHYVPLSPNSPMSRNEHIISQSGIKTIIVDDSFLLDNSAVVKIDVNSIADDAETFDAYKHDGSGDDPAYIIYTSGTTGCPKGVVVTHANLISLFEHCQNWAQLSAEDTWVLFHSYTFDFSVWEIFGALLHGGTLLILSPTEICDPYKFSEFLNNNSVTILNQTPTAFRNFVASGVRLEIPPRMIVFGGEALYPSQLKKWWDMYDESTTQLINMYGITEVTVHATYHLIQPDEEESIIGKPLDHMGIVLVDERGMACPVGVPGEIWVSGEGVCLGYVNNLELNREKFVNTSFFDLPQQRFYRSGDVAYLKLDGELCYLGRADDQLKINGHRIEASEIVGALQKINGIIDAHVCKKETEEGDHLLIAYYTAENEIDPKMIGNGISSILPSYSIPAHYLRVNSFPTTLNGKIDDDKLPLPTLLKECETSSLYETIKSAWLHILHVSDLLPDRPFFEVGGNSIKAVMLVSYINNLINKKVMSVVDVFRYPTLLEQVEILEKRVIAEGS